MYKLIAIDIDDTLLTDENELTEGTKHALAQASAKGVIVTLATGRMYSSAKQIAQQIELNVPIITYQGSYVKTLIDEQVLYERSVPQEATRYLFDFAAKNGLHLQAYYNDELYAKEENERLIQYCRNSNVPYRIESDFEKLAALPMTKLIMIDEPDKLDQIAIKLNEQIGQQVHITKSKPNFLEFMHVEGTKGHALSFLAKHFNCHLSEVIAIGDSWNDRELLQTAGLGIAMANAVEPLKEIADYITLSNNDDGVKHAIEKFILQA